MLSSLRLPTVADFACHNNKCLKDKDIFFISSYANASSLMPLQILPNSLFKKKYFVTQYIAFLHNNLL